MSGFNKQIRGFGSSTSNTTNNTNTSSDNYSYYVRNEEQESYKHKNAKWDPTRAMSNKQNKSASKNVSNHFTPINSLNPLSSIGATDKNGDLTNSHEATMRRIYGTDSNLQADNGIDNSVNTIDNMMYANKNDLYNESINERIIKNKNSKAADRELSNNSFSSFHVIFFLLLLAILFIAYMLSRNNVDDNEVKGNSYYYNQYSY